MNLKSLAKDTAIYGLSSIVGRFLNYLLIILYSYKIPAESGGYGIVTNLYAWTALLLALLTFGMETTFFRFAGKENENPENVFSTSLKMVGGAALVFLAAIFCFLKPIAGALGYSAHPEYIACFALITALDAFQAIMFVRLRQQKRPVKFVCLKLSFIFASILLNLFVFLVMPLMFDSCPAIRDAFVRYDYGVGFIFFINLICTACVTFGFIPEFRSMKLRFDGKLCRRMLKYTWPLLLLSLVGILNQVADKILFPYLMPGQEGKVQLGIYGACVKIAMIMSMLVQAFRYAYEPIVFGEAGKRNGDRTLADGMKWFIIFSLLAYLTVIFYLPLLKYIIGESYWSGLGVVPVVMLAELFMGIYFNLSFWYKLTDQTWWGAIINTIAVAIMISVNVIFVPRIGYWACAWGGLAGYGTAMLISWTLGRKKYPVAYDLKTIGMFTLLAAVLFLAGTFLGRTSLPSAAVLVINTFLLGIYCLFIWKNLKKSRI
ncbi:MAG: lipopolysaccharide biosynthesis protein [Bacteroidales bacterium]|nr:lipopolysaccharide biosynthesis protein [Bacteroidales bacterium]